MADTVEESSRDMSKQNPFRMPTDEEIFSLRDEERARKEEVILRFIIHLILRLVSTHLN